MDYIDYMLIVLHVHNNEVYENLVENRTIVKIIKLTSPLR